MTRTIILAGAPESNSLDWNEKSLLPIQHIENIYTAKSDVSSKPEIPKWRKLEMEKLKMRPLLPKLDISLPSKDVDMGAPAEFLETTELASQDLAQELTGSDVSAEDSRPSQESYEPETEALAEFYDHSFSIHEAIPSSQITGSTQCTPGTPIYESNDEMFSEQPATPGGIIRTSSQRRLSQAPRPKQLTNLGEIPGANYLKSISPQTKTVNLIVGLISIAPSRIVTTGMGWGKPRQVELVELLVGDETKIGFSITMWLPREMHVNWKDGAQEKPEGSRSILRRSLKAVRPRDVVLIQNVALSEFRGKVHGQSLRGDVTKIDTLFRKKVDNDDQAGCYTAQNLKMATGRDAQIMKVKRVRDWMVEFVGDVPEAVSTKRKSKKARMLPDDTQ
ncbi:hypothetical protein H2198_002930 [Neophaeococcomyces mojaviensis]|uniref:Uncharacterized protein n=1 Tax=Neophaeococcomyces mojaviensis TaxID=3383035 RepID=A0ACC3ACZ3_9EURO|nr:hypothetical protein H2198_002930 [Knufia sp. JES_112]